MKHTTLESITYQRIRDDIACLLDWVDTEVSKLDNHDIQRSHVRHLQKVRKDLMDTLTSLSALSSTNIQCRLEERSK